MGDIFGGDSDSLEEELAKIIEFGHELDRLNSLSLLVVLGERGSWFEQKSVLSESSISKI